MQDSLKNTHVSTQKFKDTIAGKHGIIYCYGPDDEYCEARTLREAEEMTGIHHNTIQYAIKHTGKAKGWRFERCQK